MSYGIITSKPGVNVSDPTVERKDLTFDSRLEHFQYQTTDKVVFTGSGVETIAHNLGYAPAFMAWIKENGQSQWRTVFRNVGEFEAYVDNTNLYLYGNTGDTIRYFLFTKPINPATVTDKVTTGGYGIISVIPGANANEPRLHEINFSSDFGSLIIYKELNFTIEISGAGTTTSTQSHGMGYAPTFIASVYDGLNYYTEPFIYADFTDQVTLSVLVDTTNVVAECSVTSSFVPMTAQFKVHLLTEDLD